MTKSTLVRVPVSLRGVLCAALVWGGCVDLAAQDTLDLKDWNEANSLVAKNELSSALEILRTRYGYRAKTIAGPQYWCFEGKTLSEIRQGFETGDSNE